MAALLAAAALAAPAGPAAPVTTVADQTVSCEAGLSGSLPKFILSQLAVRTPSGKPPAYASIGGTSKAHICTARRCKG